MILLLTAMILAVATVILANIARQSALLVVKVGSAINVTKLQ